MVQMCQFTISCIKAEGAKKPKNTETKTKQKKYRRKNVFFVEKVSHKQFLLKVLPFSGSVLGGAAFIISVICRYKSALCTSGRTGTIYSKCQLHSACGLQVKKARFGLVWCDFIWIEFFIRVSPVIKVTLTFNKLKSYSKKVKSYSNKVKIYSNKVSVTET